MSPEEREAVRRVRESVERCRVAARSLADAAAECVEAFEEIARVASRTGFRRPGLEQGIPQRLAEEDWDREHRGPNGECPHCGDVVCRCHEEVGR